MLFFKTSGKKIQSHLRTPASVEQARAGRRGPPISTIFMLHKDLNQLVTMVIFFCLLSQLFPRTDHPPKNTPNGVTKVMILDQLWQCVSLRLFK